MVVPFRVHSVRVVVVVFQESVTRYWLLLPIGCMCTCLDVTVSDLVDISLW